MSPDGSTPSLPPPLPSWGGSWFCTGPARTDDPRIARRIAKLNRGRLEAGGRSDEYDRLALEALDRRRRHADRTAAATARELDGSRHRLADPPFATAIVERGERRHEPRQIGRANV